MLATGSEPKKVDLLKWSSSISDSEVFDWAGDWDLYICDEERERTRGKNKRDEEDEGNIYE